MLKNKLYIYTKQKINIYHFILDSGMKNYVTQVLATIFNGNFKSLSEIIHNLGQQLSFNQMCLFCNDIFQLH